MWQSVYRCLRRPTTSQCKHKSNKNKGKLTKLCKAGRLININTNMQAHGLEGMRKIELMHASKANDAANEDIRRGVRKESSTTATQESILSTNEQ